MTTGTRSDNFLVWNQYGYTGDSASKQWSGDDYPALTRTWVWVDRPVYSRKSGLLTGWTKKLIKASNGSSTKRLPIVDHAYSCSWERVSIPPYHFSIYYEDYSGISSGDSAPDQAGFGLFPADQTWSSNDDIALVSKLASKVQGTSFHAGVALAEVDKTLLMLGSTVKRVANAWNFARKGNFRESSRILTGKARNLSGKKTIANNWLALQYGWMPLLGDVHDGAETLASILNVPRQSSVFATRASINRAPWETATGRSFGPNASPLVTGCEVGTRKRIKVTSVEADPVQLTGLTDPYSIAWERLPFSFVLDWFLPIGAWLDARFKASAIHGSFVISTKIWRKHGGLVPNGRVFQCYPLPGYSIKPDYYGNSGTFTRVLSSSIDVPLPGLKPLAKAASKLHVANAMALVTALIKSEEVLPSKWQGPTRDVNGVRYPKRPSKG